MTMLSWKDSDGARQLDLKPSEHFQILLGHKPDYSISEPPADLMLAGHTHGGQVQLPFFGPLLTLSDVPRAHAEGANPVGNGTLIVSRGIGMEQIDAPRLRFFCWPELSVIDLLPASP